MANTTTLSHAAAEFLAEQVEREADEIRARGGRVLVLQTVSFGVVRVRPDDRSAEAETAKGKPEEPEGGELWHRVVFDTAYDFDQVTAILVSERAVAVPRALEEEEGGLSLNAFADSAPAAAPENNPRAPRERAFVRFVVLDNPKRFPLMFGFVSYSSEGPDEPLRRWRFVNSNGKESRHHVDEFA
jgi:hypothetical protein